MNDLKQVVQRVIEIADELERARSRLYLAQEQRNHNEIELKATKQILNQWHKRRDSVFDWARDALPEHQYTSRRCSHDGE